MTEVPRLQAQVQPIAHSLLCIDLPIVPNFRWEEKIHGGAETFFILVEDVDSEIILFHDTFVLRQWYAEVSLSLSRCSSPSLPITTSQ